MASPHFNNVQHKRLTLLMQTFWRNGEYVLENFVVLMNPIGCYNKWSLLPLQHLLKALNFNILLANDQYKIILLLL
jgi:hypothetical protein